MRTVTCDGLDKDWSVITFGCWQIAPSEGWGDVCSKKEADAAVKEALEQGITAFDTAEGYGDGESERRLGQALGPKKDDVVIISKIWPDAELTLPSYQKHLEDTLTALGREYVDVYLIHWPGSYFDTSEKSARLCDIMNALKESGKTRIVGLSNFHEENLRLLGSKISRFSVNEVPYNMLERRYEGNSRQICLKSGLEYMAFSPTAQGLLAGRVSREARNSPTRQSNRFYQEPLFSQALKVLETVKDIADEAQRKPVEVAVAWVLAQDNILTAIVGSHKVEQIREFSGAADLKLSKQQLQRLTSAASAL
ncbi:MAG: aldo/keto reductase [Nitrospinae bacterium]|nr:aldo/keto reductase [Nitrospinota bacterium]MCH8314100.1 aldo/keto reductase [Nitrospinota bacterium]